jgi:hypothetical protein
MEGVKKMILDEGCERIYMSEVDGCANQWQE